MPKENFCDLCGKSFSLLHNLTRHKRTIHNEKQDNTKSSLRCLECEETFTKLKFLRTHLTDEHGIEMEYENKVFNSYEEFTDWKLQTQKRDNANYIFKNDKCGRILFYCNRSGSTKSPKADRKRSYKSQGSRKLNFFCTSTVQLTRVDDCFVLHYCKTHYGHSTRDVQHVDIPAIDQQNIALDLMLGMTPSEVLEKRREKYSDTFSRMSILSKQDILNIKAKYKVGDTFYLVKVNNENDDQ